MFAPLSTAVHTLTLDSVSRQPKLAEQTGLALREKARDISTAVRLRPRSRLRRRQSDILRVIHSAVPVCDNIAVVAITKTA